VNLDVTVTVGEENFVESLLNLSLGGALMTFSKRLDIGSKLTMSFQCPGNEKAVETEATVRWATDEEAGVQFDGLRARDVWSLNEFFKSLPG
jgi:hypothetical protein